MKWTDYENETLIHNHKVSKVFKKKYKRASEFHNALYRLFGILTVLSSTISTTLIWSLDLQQDELYYSNTTYSIIDHNFNIIPIKLIVFLSAFTASIQNFYKFQDNSNNYLITSNLYSNIKGKIEAVGNIHPEYRTITPSDFFKKIQDKLDHISDNRIDLNTYISKYYYSRDIDSISYLETKHEKFKGLQDLEKLKFSKTLNIRNIDTEEEESDEDIA